MLVLLKGTLVRIFAEWRSAWTSLRYCRVGLGSPVTVRGEGLNKTVVVVSARAASEGFLGRVDEGADGFVKPVFSLILRDDNHRRYEQNGHSTVNRKVGVRESDICHDCSSIW